MVTGQTWSPARIEGLAYALANEHGIDVTDFFHPVFVLEMLKLRFAQSALLSDDQKSEAMGRIEDMIRQAEEFLAERRPRPEREPVRSQELQGLLESLGAAIDKDDKQLALRHVKDIQDALTPPAVRLSPPQAVIVALIIPMLTLLPRELRERLVPANVLRSYARRYRAVILLFTLYLLFSVGLAMLVSGYLNP